MNTLETIVKVLVIIGAINWGLIGIGSFSTIDYSWDLVALVAGSVPWLAAIIYLLVGLSGLWAIKWLKE